MSGATTEQTSIDSAAPTPPSRGRFGWLKKTLVALAAIVGVLAVVVAAQPSDFRVSRSATMVAQPNAVFAQVNDFHKWDAWSPWAKLDPAAKNTFEGPSSGVGASLAWDGNNDVGAGRMTITEAREHELIRIRLEFIRPFAGASTAEFTFQPQGDKTIVTWSMFGEQKFIGKAFSLFMDCDAMMGGEFEKGLANMKAIVERPQHETAPVDAAALNTET